MRLDAPPLGEKDGGSGVPASDAVASDLAGPGADDPGVNAQWGGRFRVGVDATMRDINASIDVDRRLWRQDIAGSRAHADMLGARNIIAAVDRDAILAGLDAIAADIETGRFDFSVELEDIHMNVEASLIERIGEPGRRLHTARSRNDQVATDLRLWVRDAIASLDGRLASLMHALATRAATHAADPMPGLTHLQSAQPVTFGHHLLAYVEMLHRDRGRLADARRRGNECPLGAGALAGTSFPIDRHATARALGFDAPMANSLDAVSARDFALEYLSALAILASHLSRLAEEIVIWCASPFGLVRLSDRWSTGSSIMPQKRNPDAAELVRAKTGRAAGALFSLLTVMKGLPLAYGKDMQEDKAPIFEATDAMALAVAATDGMVRDLRPDLARMRALAGDGYATATDLADWLVRVLGLPFRDAHHATGRIVRAAEEAGVPLERLPLDAMRAVEPRIDEGVRDVLGVDASVRSRVSFGGSAPANVAREAARWLAALDGDAAETPA